jgi:hypothetical protein
VGDTAKLYDLIAAALLALTGAVQLVMWREILKLRDSRYHHAQVLQRHVGRFARLGERLGIEWDDLEKEL